MGPRTSHPHPQPPMQQADAAPHALGAHQPGCRFGLALSPDRGGHLGVGWGGAMPSRGRRRPRGHGRGSGNHIQLQGAGRPRGEGGRRAPAPSPGDSAGRPWGAWGRVPSWGQAAPRQAQRRLGCREGTGRRGDSTGAGSRGCAGTGPAVRRARVPTASGLGQDSGPRSPRGLAPPSPEVWPLDWACGRAVLRPPRGFS